MKEEIILKLKQNLYEEIQKSHFAKFIDKNSFIRFLNNNDKDFYSRENKEGHITSSCFCVNEDLSKVLLVKHKKFGLWLQPGGHWDDIDKLNITTYENAIKELSEECFEENPFDYKAMLNSQIFNLDAHQAGDHYHYDVGYLIKIPEYNKLYVNQKEVDDVQWFDIDYVCNSEKGFTSSRVKDVFNFIKYKKQEILEEQERIEKRKTLSM